MRCLDDQQVLDYVGRRDAAADVAEIQKHLDGCADCLSLVTAMNATQSGGAPVTTRPLPAVDDAHYALGDTIAVGGMGRIIAATDRRLDRPIAIKELLVDSGELRTRFEREARITARLQHPSIVNLLEAGTWPSGEPFFAMKRVVGESLAKRLRRTGSLDERLGLLANMIALADALAYAHDQRIVHRDLKPDNVLLGDYGETVVIDWGLAKQLGVDDDAPLAIARPATPTDTVAGTVLGTPSYMPPEQALGKSVDETADVYALGAILYEVLSGRPPYRGTSVEDVLAAVMKGPPPPLRDGVPRDLVTIVEKAMAREPEHRYPTAKPLAEEIRRFQTGQLVASHDYTIRQRLGRWVRKHRGAVGVGAAALVLLATGAVIGVRGILDERARADEQRDVAVAARTEAEARRRDSDELMDFMLGDLHPRLAEIGKLKLLGTVAEKARDYYAHRPPPTDNEDRRRLIEARLNLGSVLTTQGDTVGGSAALHAAVELAEQLVTSDPAKPKYQLSLLRSRLRLAQLLATQGDTAGARDLFTAVIDGATRLLAIDPANIDAMYAAQDGNLRLGDIVRQQGDVKGALVYEQKSLALARALVAMEPTTKAQRSLSLSLRVLAAAYSQLDDQAAAAPYIVEAASVSEALLAQDPTNAALGQDVLRTREKVAEVLVAKGDLDGALVAVMALRKSAVSRAEQDPADATRVYDLGMGLRRVALTRMARKEYVAAIAELRLARKTLEEITAKDTANKLWQSGLSYVVSDLGRALEANKQLADALVEYTTARDLRAQLVAHDPQDGSIKNDLAFSQEMLANTLRDLGKYALAVTEFEKALALDRELAAAHPDDLDRQVELYAMYAHVGEAQALAKQRAAALARYQTSLRGFTELAAKKPGSYGEELATIRAAMAKL